MSKENLRKHTSIKNALPGLERKQSRQDLRDQTGSEITCTESEVMKKIQNKLRMRKRSNNQNGNERLTGTPPDLSSTGNLSNQPLTQTTVFKGLQGYDLSIDIPETVQKNLDRNEVISDKIVMARLGKEAVKEQLLKDSTFILCQLNKGRKMQDILLERITAIIETNKMKRRIEQKQKSIIAMMDERIKKLMFLQKPLVH